MCLTLLMAYIDFESLVHIESMCFAQVSRLSIVMDASYNRIRELRSDTFAPYSRMKYLYLGDNMIQTIEAGAFDTMPNLEALDLSINSIFTVPMQIFQLPSLKNLYLQHNNLRTLRQDLKDLQKPIRAPLQRINLAYCRLQLLPDLGILPDLTEFNISGNPLLSLLPVDIAPSCSLKSLDMTEINVDYCSCLLLEKWFNNHVPNVLHSTDDLCTAPPRGYTYCAEDIKLNETNVLYDTCQEMILHRKLEYNAKMIWIIVASTIATVLLTLGCVLYALHKRNSRKRHRTLKTNQLNNGNLEALLNK
ncbi:vasorin-like [Ctenocephalides felis]|uniref:vasorin-like n=1 Tax=Ctenocephalides felis TaxID=7515 RepID=UPI000E6E2BAF|nr:vasorin-like [Ctenocephalides felis]